MRPTPCLVIRRLPRPLASIDQRRTLLTLAVETSCDDTSVAVLEKHQDNSATLHFNSKITSDNRSYGGVNPIVALDSHQQNVAVLVNKALKSLPVLTKHGAVDSTFDIREGNGGPRRRKPDFVTVTRGPGMRASLITGIHTAKGLAVAWQVPFLGVNHMQAHALTPRLVSALNANVFTSSSPRQSDPAFPFLTLLVSGGHTMLVHSKSLCNHKILANTTDIAIGDAIDKCARDILPQAAFESAPDVMYGPLLESFAFPTSAEMTAASCFMAQDTYAWQINKPYTRARLSEHSHQFSYSGIGSFVKRRMAESPNMEIAERQVLAKEAMRVAFEHLASRVLLALEATDTKHVKTLVVSGGVASNQYLKALLRNALDTNGHANLRLIFPPPRFCIDNAAMIAWLGIEMYEAGWKTDLSATAINRWAIDPEADDGGILGIKGWIKDVA